MRLARVLRMILRIFVLVLSLSMSLISFLGGLSAALILSNPNAIKIPDGNIESNFDILHPNNIYIKVPFTITNEGYFDLEDLYLTMTITAVDAQGNEIVIFQKKTIFGDVLKDGTLKTEYYADENDFLISNIYAAILTLDVASGIALEADIVLGASYEMGLLSFRIELHHIPMGSLT